MEAEGVAVLSSVEVEDLEFDSDVVTAVRTTAGRLGVGEQLVLAPGPWAKQFWAMLGLPMQIDIRTPSGEVVTDRPMWTYWNLQEGEITVDPLTFATADVCASPSSISTRTRRSTPTTASLVTDELWGSTARFATA
jgi:glycine/D-amino acid oxidase-like deaminating enzyme